MTAADLRILQRVLWNASMEICIAEERVRPGDLRILLRMLTEEAQRLWLENFGRAFPLFFDKTVLCSLLPLREGVPAGRWLRENASSFAQRRALCLALALRLEKEAPPPAVLWRLAEPDNLLVGAEELFLQCFLDFSPVCPEPDSRSACSKTAALLLQFLSGGKTVRPRAGLPPEYLLVLRRARANAYAGMHELCQDLAALPESLPEVLPTLSRGRAKLKRMESAAARVLSRAAVPVLLTMLGAAAALCCAGALFTHRPSAEPAGTGVVSVGNQTWGAWNPAPGKDGEP